jgi:hypothetical protein
MKKIFVDIDWHSRVYGVCLLLIFWEVEERCAEGKICQKIEIWSAKSSVRIPSRNLQSEYMKEETKRKGRYSKEKGGKREGRKDGKGKFTCSKRSETASSGLGITGSNVCFC